MERKNTLKDYMKLGGFFCTVGAIVVGGVVIYNGWKMKEKLSDYLDQESRKDNILGYACRTLRNNEGGSLF